MLLFFSFFPLLFVSVSTLCAAFRDLFMEILVSVLWLAALIIMLCTEHYVIMCLTRQVTDIIQFLVLLKFTVLSVTKIITVAHTTVMKEEPVKKILPRYSNKGGILRSSFNLFSSSLK